MGDLLIKQEFKEGEPTNYYRDLNLNTAVSTTSFNIGQIKYTRQYFINAPSNVMVIVLKSSAPGGLNLHIRASSQLHYQVEAKGKTELQVKGKAPSKVDPSYFNPKGRVPVIYEDPSACNGMRFQFNIRAISKDGKIDADTSGIVINQATEVTLYLTAATSFNGFDKCPDKEGLDENKLVNTYLEKAVALGSTRLLDAHKKDYQKYFNRVSLKIKDTTTVQGS